MPRGAKPGERRGGRAKGTKNKVTIKNGAEIAAERKQSGRKLAIEVMSDAMHHWLNLCVRYQPVEGNPTRDEKLFDHYLKRATDVAGNLAQYETPKLQSTTLKGDGPADQTGAHPIELLVRYV